MRKDRRQRADSLRPDAGSIRPVKKVFFADVDLFQIRGLTQQWRIKMPQDICIWLSQGMRTARWKTIIHILQQVNMWRDSKRGGI